MKIQLTDIQIPSGCTHWTRIPAINDNTKVQYRFYKVLCNGEVVFIYFNSKWMSWSEYTQWCKDHTPIKHDVPSPDFNSKWFNRHEETAQDKIAAIAAKI